MNIMTAEHDRASCSGHPVALRPALLRVTAIMAALVKPLRAAQGRRCARWPGRAMTEVNARSAGWLPHAKRKEITARREHRTPSLSRSPERRTQGRRPGGRLYCCMTGGALSRSRPSERRARPAGAPRRLRSGTTDRARTAHARRPRRGDLAASGGTFGPGPRPWERPSAARAAPLWPMSVQHDAER